MYLFSELIVGISQKKMAVNINKSLEIRMPPISVNNAASAFGKSHTLNFFQFLAQTKQVSPHFITSDRLFEVSRIRSRKVLLRYFVSFVKLWLQSLRYGHMAYIT